MTAEPVSHLAGAGIPDRDRADVVRRGDGLAIGAEGEVPDDTRPHAGDAPEDFAGFQVEDDHQAVALVSLGVASPVSKWASDLTGRGQPSSIGTEGDSWNRLSRFIVAEARTPLGNRPGLDPSAQRCRGDELSVRSNGDSVDRPARCSRMSIDTHAGCLTQDVEHRQAGTNPASLVLDVTGHQDSLPVGEEGDPGDRPGVASPGACTSGLASRVPHLDRLIRAARRQPSSIGTEGHAGDVLAVTAQRAEFLAGRGVPELDGPIGTAGRDPSLRRG